MKRISFSLLALFTHFIASYADEGMWMMYNLPDAVYNQMTAEGYQLPKTSLYGGLSRCVVNFGGFCTGEVVSPQGLVMTNHHCGFEAVRSHSTVEHDYMLNGFYAETVEDELANENLFVAFMMDQRDVTPMLDSLGIKDMDDIIREEIIDSLNQVLTEEAKGKDSTYYVEIDAFYEGNAYYATTYQRYNDVRLVYSPPKSLGKFGGETDNWMWPRQTCDISVFRIYVDPETGGPADYSEKNVPMQTEHFIKVSTDGYKEGDFAMTIGYPGSTERYLSSYGIEELRNSYYDPMQQVRGIKQEIMKRHMDRSEAVRIKYDSKYAQSSNYWKNAIGMNKCIDSIGIINMKREYEQRIQAFADSVGIPLNFEKLKKHYAYRAKLVKIQTLFAETFGRRSQNELAIRAMKYYNGMEIYGPENKPSKQYVMFADNSDKWDRDLDCEAMAAMMKNFWEQLDSMGQVFEDNAMVATAYRPDCYTTVFLDFNGDYTKYVNTLWDESVLMRSGTKLPVKMTKKMERDLGLQFGKSLVDALEDIKYGLEDVEDSIAIQERLLCAAKLRMEQDMPHYSDANFTMRLSYGQIGGYMIGGYDSGYYTTAESFIKKAEKADSNEEFFAESVFHELMARKDFGVYTDSISKTLNLCFLSNNDITGGNSGSPVIDGNGKLIGLAFDGNWDSLSADIYYDAVLARTISVDIRYVLYIMQEWAKADRLLQEMGILVTTPEFMPTKQEE